MAQRRPLTASEHRGHEAPVTRERQMANGVNGTVNRVQPAPPHAPLDRGFAEPERHELSAPDHSVLPPSELRECQVEGVRGNLTVHNTVK
jgi:hypothetical protein